ncbi:hypothetical protein COV18_01515 [Candidatus Woesearchaeota archaeon CG10_big_fil_rev_8_21_14_0_10_37_12]|nr:MAG: hypothetical protein COV18_01515 [Candidatus Woesearchaeota archaeon CG10_big_fil_rev_8_21_14_0_10_37_12]
MDRAPVYVKLEEYKDIVDLVSLAREKLQQAKMLLGNIQELKRQEDQELMNWARQLTEAEQSMSQIDKSLMEPK